ncbi:CoA transferase [Rhodococcus aerolatus]
MVTTDGTDAAAGGTAGGTAGPLDGVRVVDLSSVVMGPFAAQILGDLGADVVKVEPPAGDLTRLTLPQRNPGMGSLSLNVNRNKRAVALDLKAAEGREAFLALLRTADVLVTNMRPGALARLHLSYPELAAVNPALVYCNAQGFRGDSEKAGLAAYDEIVQAASGMVDLMRRGAGTPTYVPTILGDKVCALTIVYSVLAALVHQRATGQGQQVEVPMVDTLVSFLMVEHLAGHTYVPAEGPTGFNRSITPGHRAARTADGWACILPYTTANIVDFFTAAGRPDLAGEPMFVDYAQRAAHWGDLYDTLDEVARTRTTAEWQELCAEHSIPFAPVLEIETAEDDPYLAAGGILQTDEHPTEGRYRRIGSPLRFSATPTSIRRHAPGLGEHTAEVLAELGYDEPTIAAMLAAGQAVAGGGA